MVAQSPQIRDGNFRLIGTDDLERLFDWYDSEFFRGRLGEMLLEDEANPVAFRLSRRLVSAAGQTIRQVRRRRAQRASRPPGSTTRSPSRPLCSTTHFRTWSATVTVGGLVCRDRLEALQRIFEHELLAPGGVFGAGAVPIAGPTISMRSPAASSPTKAPSTT